MSRPDEIMAQYLLKGGKMLAESCPVCHNPLFEYKSIRQCVVCQNGENGPEKPQEKMEKSTLESQIHADSLRAQDVNTNQAVQQAACDALLHTLLRITQENDVRSISELSASCSILTEVYLALIDPQSHS
jgi:UPF0148 protein